MSVYICKNISSHLSYICSPVNKLLCIQYHYISSSTHDTITNSSTQDPFTVSYLRNSCGLSSENARLASKYLTLKTPENADSVINLFKKHGFTNTQISRIVIKHPLVLASNFEKTIAPKLEYFTSKGFSRSDLAKFVCSRPRILTISLENKIIPTWSFFKSVLNSNDKTLKVTKQIFTSRCVGDVQPRLIPNIKILKEFGVKESHIVSLLTSHPSVMVRDSDTFRMTVERVKQMGFSPERVMFVYAVCVLGSMSKSIWEKKVEIRKKWGWSEEDVYVAFGKHPLSMMVSVDKITLIITLIMDMLINKSGYEHSDIVRRPRLLTCSFEKRIVPRCSFYQVLLGRGLITKKWSLVVLLETTEKQFVEKIRMCYKEAAPELLSLYKKKLEIPV